MRAAVRFSIEPRFRFRQAGTGVFEGDQIMLGSFNGGLWVYSHPQGRSVYADSPFRRPRREVSLGQTPIGWRVWLFCPFSKEDMPFMKVVHAD